MAIQLRRGSYSDLDTSRLLAGELAVVLSGDPTVSDGKMLYIAFASGDVKRVATWEDAAALIAAYLDDALELVVQGGNDAINVTEVNGTYSVKHKALYTQGKDGADPIASNIGDRTSLGNTTLSPGGSFWVPCVDIDKYGHVKGLGYRKLTLPGSGGYATLEQAGIVKPDGETINVDVDGTISAVPYEHPSYTALTGKPTSNQTPSFGSTFTVSQVKTDGTGHVTEMNDRTVKIPSTTATTSSAGLMSSTDKSKLNGIANNATANTASTSTPKMDGTASYGSATAYARGDHVHPTDTSRAAATDLSSHTGDTDIHITAAERAAWNAKASTDTATQSTNGLMSSTDKTKLDNVASGATANTASTATPLVDGTASAGSSDAYARGDHVHPTDTTRAPLASPEFTGTPKAPTAALNTDTTQIASTAFVHQEMANGAKANSSRHLGFYIDQDGDLCQA